MHFTSLLFSTAAVLSAVVAQSPRGFTPFTNKRLGVAYGNVTLRSGEKLPQALPDTVFPTVYSPGHYPGKYYILLTDLSIPDANFFNASQIPYLVPGLGVNRTTRLHWWQQNVTHSSKTGKFLFDNTTSYAPYAGPQPPLNDTFHDYVFWLFNAPANYSGPSAAEIASWQDQGSTARFNFSLPDLVGKIGEPLASTYFRTENAGNPGAPTTPQY